jgi:hypothetical protein
LKNIEDKIKHQVKVQQQQQQQQQQQHQEEEEQQERPVVLASSSDVSDAPKEERDSAQPQQGEAAAGDEVFAVVQELLLLVSGEVSDTSVLRDLEAIEDDRTRFIYVSSAGVASATSTGVAVDSVTAADHSDTAAVIDVPAALLQRPLMTANLS